MATITAPLATGVVPADEMRDDQWWMQQAETMMPAAAIALGDPDWTLDSLHACGAAAAMIAWTEYRHIAAMHTQLTTRHTPIANRTGTRMLDVDAQVAARIAMAKGITQRAAENWVTDAVAMRDRLTNVGMTLRAGIISPRQFRLIITRTELTVGFDWAPQIDLAIADVLRRRRGTWSTKRLTDMVDRIIFRHDPDAVRRRHKDANNNRSVWLNHDSDGMATLGAQMSAHNAALCFDAINRLATSVCAHDPRSIDNRRSDAVYALLTGTAFDCDCGQTDCDASTPNIHALAAWVRAEQNTAITKGAVLVHVIANHTTIAGDDDDPAYLDGHGVISAAHLHDLLQHPATQVRPINPHTTTTTSASPSLPTYQPADPYRPSAALNTFIRARDGYCTIPGCDRPAWACDLDHVTEYDHTNPTAGGQTHPDDLTAKCRAHHLLKTFGDGWLDDQYRDTDGRLVSEVISPEGIRFPGPAETNEQLFPDLATVTWHNPASPPLPHSRHPTPGSRTQAKHARRRRERNANRQQRLAQAPPETSDPPPF